MSAELLLPFGQPLRRSATAPCDPAHTSTPIPGNFAKLSLNDQAMALASLLSSPRSVSATLPAPSLPGVARSSSQPASAPVSSLAMPAVVPFSRGLLAAVNEPFFMQRTTSAKPVCTKSLWQQLPAKLPLPFDSMGCHSGAVDMELDTPLHVESAKNDFDVDSFLVQE